VERDPYDVVDLKALKCLWASAKEGSLTRAGVMLGISDAAVSQRIKSLEIYLGTKLYEARGGKFTLTRAGERAMDLAIRLFDELGAFEHAVAEPGEDLIIGTHDIVLRYMLPPVIETLSTQLPHVSLRLRSRTLADTIAAVRTNDFDLGVVPEANFPPELQFYPIETYRSYLITPRNHPIMRMAKADFASLLDQEIVARYPLIVSEAQQEIGVIRRTLEQRGLSLNVGIEVGDMDTLKYYVARGYGIGAVSALCITSDDQDKLDILEIPEKYHSGTTYGVLMRKDKHLSHPIQAFLAAIGAEEIHERK
jgi:LysR family cys regulon transcriptional activator